MVAGNGTLNDGINTERKNCLCIIHQNDLSAISKEKPLNVSLFDGC